MRTASLAALALGVVLGIFVSYVAIQISSLTTVLTAVTHSVTCSVTASVVVTSPVTVVTSITLSPVTMTVTRLSVRSEQVTETVELTMTKTTTELFLPYKWIMWVTIYNYSFPASFRPGLWKIDNKTMGVRLDMWTNAPYEYPNREAVLMIKGPGVNVTLSDDRLKELGFDITKAKPETWVTVETTIVDVSPVVGEKYHVEVFYQREDGSNNYAAAAIANDPLSGGKISPAGWMNFIMTDGDPGNYPESNWGGPDP